MSLITAFRAFARSSFWKYNMKIRKSMEYWWNNSERGKPNYWERKSPPPNPEPLLPSQISPKLMRSNAQPSQVREGRKSSSYRAVNTLYISVIQTSQLMLYREIKAVCSEIHTKHINTLCGQNVEMYIKIQSVPWSKHTLYLCYTNQSVNVV